MTNRERHPASFKDPAGYIFMENGRLLRQVNLEYSGQYTQLRDSGLLTALWEKKWLLHHQELPGHTGEDGNAWLVLAPRQIPFNSYPYEWSFDMLKDAALLTLAINRKAVDYGMILKDASAYNILFDGSQPVFIDTLSFESYDAARPWIAYRQFCQHFLFPLLINHYKGIEAQQWLQLHHDGLPVQLTAELLPFRTKFSLGPALHVHLQNRIAMRHQGEERQVLFSKTKMVQILQHLESVIRSLRYRKRNSTWNQYYQQSILSREYLREKETAFRKLLNGLETGTAIDLGANTGNFTLILSEAGFKVIAVDADPQAVNELYLAASARNDTKINPMVTNLVNPSPGTGWDNQEHQSFLKRGKADIVVALALIHHLYFTNNIPLESVARQLAKLSKKYCIVEMIPAHDEKVLQISREKKALLAGYTFEAFEHHLTRYFSIVQRVPLLHSDRVLYLIKKNEESTWPKN
ncbi:class I SAM-dependent methyltransferase [Flavihumibacter solisilvae]|uniref:SAM-dependent methyltransferase n=1 Tax=Flavihumibacter solisilvae TaxID=1349421 RepID=A0A0C1L1Y2_9BACT|nr:methyltransferase domain-containing protein [Flavihumibacter solisilvae]KIC93601.1 hypothetical protein OI18_17055 [Flavihumibacter solisilvae]